MSNETVMKSVAVPVVASVTVPINHGKKPEKFNGTKGVFVLGENDFRKSFSPKPVCLAITENEIFQKITSC